MDKLYDSNQNTNKTVQNRDTSNLVWKIAFVQKHDFTQAHTDDLTVSGRVKLTLVI